MNFMGERRGVRECVTGGREVRRKRAKLGNQRSSFIHKSTGNQDNKQMGTKPVAHQRKRAHVLTINNPTQRHGGNRGLNIQQVIEGIETRCEQKQDCHVLTLVPLFCLCFSMVMAWVGVGSLCSFFYNLGFCVWPGMVLNQRQLFIGVPD